MISAVIRMVCFNKSLLFLPNIAAIATIILEPTIRFVCIVSNIAIGIFSGVYPNKYGTINSDNRDPMIRATINKIRVYTHTLDAFEWVSNEVSFIRAIKYKLRPNPPTAPKTKYNPIILSNSKHIRTIIKIPITNVVFRSFLSNKSILFYVTSPDKE